MRNLNREARAIVMFTIAFAFIMIISMQGVHAATWDDRLDYDFSNKVVSVRNSILGIIPTSEIGTVELKTGFYNLVPIGTDIKVMEFDTTSAESYLGGLGITEAYDVRRNNQSVSKQLTYKVKSYQSDTRDTYTNVCTTYANKTSSCKLEKNGTEIYQREVWTTVNGNDLPKGKITIGIFTDVEAGDVIDLVPTLFGKRIGRWAVYAADPANVAYYKLDEGTGTAALNSVDSAKFKLELINTPDWTLGKIGNATTYKSASTESAQNLTFSGLGRNYSVSLWVNVTSFINDLEGVIVWTTGADNGGFALEKKSGSNSFSVYTGNGATYLETTSPVIATNVWYHYVMVSNSTHVSIYLNGSLVGFTAVVANPINPNQLFLGRGAAADANRRFDGAIDEVYIINRTLSQAEIGQLYNANRGLQWPFSVITETNLTNPANNSKFTSVTGRTFNATAIVIPAGSAVNSTLYVYTSAGALIGTNFTTVTAATNKSNFTMPDLGDGTFFWNINFCPGDGSDCVFGTSNYTYSVDSTNPVVKFPLPVNNSYVYSTNSSYATFNLNVSGTDGVAIDKAWYNSTYNSTITFVANNAITQVNLTNIFGKHTIYAFVNDTAGNLAMNQSTIWIHKNVFTNITFETESSLFSLELWNLTAAPTNTYLNYSGTNYEGTVTSLGNGKYNLTRGIDIPAGNGNKLFSWLFTDNSVEKISANITQTVNSSIFTLCNASINTAFLNITFKDESNGTILNAAISTSSWQYYLGSKNTSKTYTFSNTTENLKYAFCFIPSSKTLHQDSAVSYYASGYPVRRAVFTSDLTSVTTNQTLYLLSSATGIYSSFQITNLVGNPLSGVTVTIQKEINGANVILETATSDGSGLVTFWVDPNADHTVTASKTGYTTSTQTVRPTQSLYTIILSDTSGNASYSSSLEGITWLFRPGVGRVTSNISTNFNVTIQATKSNLAGCRFVLANQTGNISTASTGCAVGGGTLTIAYTPRPNEELRGIIALNLGSGFFTVDSDAYWISYGNVSSYRTLKGFFQDLSNLNEFGTGVEQEFSKIVFFFLALTIGLGLITFFTGYDFSNPGFTILLLYSIILFASLSGWFQYENLIGESVFAPDSETQVFLEKYIYAVIMTFLFLGWLLNAWRKQNG